MFCYKTLKLYSKGTFDLENKNNSAQKNTTFSSLKTLSGLLSGTELNSFASAINKAKRALDTFCKQLKEKEVA